MPIHHGKSQSKKPGVVPPGSDGVENIPGLIGLIRHVFSSSLLQLRVRVLVFYRERIKMENISYFIFKQLYQNGTAIIYLRERKIM